MPKFDVKGNNNRIAGNDYHEYRAPEPCPFCEVRYLTPGRTCCRHCEAEFEANERLRKKEASKLKRQAKVFRFMLPLMAILVISLIVGHFGPDEWRGISLVTNAAICFIIFIVSKLFIG